VFIQNPIVHNVVAAVFTAPAVVVEGAIPRPYKTSKENFLNTMSKNAYKIYRSLNWPIK
jgi:hypothetical protein